MKKWVTRIPTHFNDGSAIPDHVLNEVWYLISKEFGGASIDGPGRGIWVDSDGKVYDEASYVVSVACSEEQIQMAREVVSQIGKMLHQKAMYFELSGGTVEILPTE
jgi:hypothetical protein